MVAGQTGWRKTKLVWMLALGIGLAGLMPGAASAAGVELYTTYSSIAVPPGQSITYSVDVINDTDATVKAPLGVEGLPGDWTYKVRGGGWELKEVAVLPGETRSVSVEVTVPLQVDQGAYPFRVTAGTLASMPLSIEVTEKGTYQTELKTDQANLEGHAESSFTYSVTLQNRTADKQNYALHAQVQPGWIVKFMSAGKQVSSVEVEAGASQSITVDATPPAQVTEGAYPITVSASNQTTSSELALEAVITGSYGLELTTPSGLLSSQVTAGGSRTLELLVKNTGTSDLENVNLSSTTPIDWEISFNPKTIDSLAAGESIAVEARITASKKAIAGDYTATMTATAPEARSEARFRFAVEGSMLWGWIGVLVIAAVAGGIAYMIRKYGRR